MLAYRPSASGRKESLVARAKKARPVRRPRAPLPRQTGGAHEDKTRRPWRERKHKGKSGADE